MFRKHKHTINCFIIFLFSTFSCHFVQAQLPEFFSNSSPTSTIKNDSLMEHIQRVNNSVVVLDNKDKIIPIMNLGTNRIAVLSLCTQQKKLPFHNMLKRYTRINSIAINPDSLVYKKDKLIEKLKNYDIIIVSLHSLNVEMWNQSQHILSEISEISKTIITEFGSDNLLNYPTTKKTHALLYSPKDTPEHQYAAAQIIFGGLSAKGKLSSATPLYPEGTGLETKGEIRFQYTIPEMAGVDSHTLYRVIDSVAQLGIEEHAFPGCQVMVIKDRKVIYHKCFGHHTYLQKIAVKSDDIYDLASLTKITGTLPALMKFVDEGKLDLDERLSTYWRDLSKTDKKGIILREVLSHQARLTPWIPYWKETVDKDGNYKKRIFRYHKSGRYCTEVSPHMYLNRNYKKKIFKAICESPLLPKKEYKYSGLAFYIFPEIIKSITDIDYPEYVSSHFYRPLGAYTLTFNAYKSYPLSRIIPTEEDNFFRHTLLHGYVDDEGCAMMGGISGNAGLFATAGDLAKLMQMYLQMGQYGGKRYISEETMKEFTRCQFPDNKNRRGLGFDKPLLGNDTLSIRMCYPAYSASYESFGHSGFTGTFAWADPKNNTLFIFLSNRVHPSRSNRGIYENNIRTAIHQGIYDAIEVFQSKNSRP